MAEIVALRPAHLWQRGQSGNPAGRAKGSRNRRRFADLDHVESWRAYDWAIHALRTRRDLPRNTSAADIEHAAKFRATVAWLYTHVPEGVAAGRCYYCKQVLGILGPQHAPMVSQYGAWVHHACLPAHLDIRWQQGAKAVETILARIKREITPQSLDAFVARIVEAKTSALAKRRPSRRAKNTA